MEETVYTSDSQLRSPGRVASDLWADLRVAPPVAWRLFLQALRADYRQSRLGYVWLLLPTLATTAMWVYLNSAKVFEVGPTEAPYPLYVMTGTLLWQVFAEALQAPLQQLTSARAILTKSRTPHEALLLAGLLQILFNFTVRGAALLPLYVWLGARLSWAVMLVPLGVAALLLLGFSAGLLLAPVGLLYRDVSRGLNLLLGFWFFLTPVIYPKPESGAAALTAMLNPVSPLLSTTRRWLANGAVAVEPGAWQVCALSLFTLAAGWLCYRLARPHLVARL